ncbi:hypothetical protein [Spongiactinospora gelatinilytica]|uniref:hypothetical protein n=1 Tax=Spongiactinospora gelatinilytica TaxID=2666298 RepID=UPI0011B94096|nr:hypothetical protein [Spongiactinospora gelatinilytica]
MNVSRQTIFAVSFGLVFAAAVPGAAGYLTGRLEAVRAAERDLRILEADLLPGHDRRDQATGLAPDRADGRSTDSAPVCRIPPRTRPTDGHGEAAAPRAEAEPSRSELAAREPRGSGFPDRADG